jgi:predicted secreted protein
MRGFVFAVVFIIVFSALVAAIPIGLQGVGDEVQPLTPIDPSILTDFTDYENYTKSDFTEIAGYFVYEYNLAARDWIAGTDGVTFTLQAKVYFFFLWLGQTDVVKFMSPNGVDRGDEISFTNIDNDSDDGAVRYAITFTTSGKAAGAFVCYYNTTTYSTSTDAWDNDELYMLHGVGIESTATNDIGALIISLLLIRLPDVPPLVNIFLAVPIWACIIYVLWFIIKEMIPFV